MTLGDMQERGWSTVARFLVTVSNGGNNHPIFESATIAETKWREKWHSDHLRVRLWRVRMDSSWRISAMLTILATDLLRQKQEMRSVLPIIRQSALQAYGPMHLRTIDDPVSMARLLQGAISSIEPIIRKPELHGCL
jgi:hypothetical protein